MSQPETRKCECGHEDGQHDAKQKCQMRVGWGSCACHSYRPVLQFEDCRRELMELVLGLERDWRLDDHIDRSLR